ncbi:MAG TPA: DNA polymerase III subunit gamma/tau [Candidatus Saccharimonadales bacterium]
MGQVLYRKYRSKSLSEIIGQEHITKTLEQALKTGRISHAYLFTGPRGVGKTSIARILAHEVNGLKYEDDKPHIDIVEIDAASNRRIDEIRDLRDKVHITPSSAKYKVYIIDEVHMLTKEAFNALLKTLEEPPEHVIFILATTDAHKLPETIISRTQRFSFKPVDKTDVVDHLRSIAKKEKINISDGALGVIADHGEGSFRDSISLLDQLSNSSDKVDEDDVLNLLGIPSQQAINKLIDELQSNSTALSEINSSLNAMYGQGYTAQVIAKALLNELRDQLVDDKLAMPRDKVLNLLKDLIEVEPSADPNTYLAVCLMSVTDNNLSHEVKTPVVKTIDPPVSTQKPTKDETEPLSPASETPKVEKPAGPIDEQNIWPEALNILKKRYNTLYGIVRMATPVFRQGNELDLVFDFAFHQKRVNDSKNKQLLANVLSEVTGENFTIECQLANKPARVVAQEETPLKISSQQANTDLDNISQIFGDAQIID